MTIRAIIISALMCVGLISCQGIDLDDDRIPRTAVYIPFTTESEWHTYGIGGYMGQGGAIQARRFIRVERIPANYQYPDYSYTGFGGVLLTCDALSQLHAFDLACPVERQPTVRLAIQSDLFAHCAKCGSTYDVFGLERIAGSPTSGIAFSKGYALRRYRVLFGVDGRYALISQ